MPSTSAAKKLLGKLIVSELYSDNEANSAETSFQNIIDQFEQKEIDILVGTQMITKGLDFQNVHLVGVLNADHLMNFPDFRAHERTYQMLSQVAGRAGRKALRGKVLIQTYQPHQRNRY